VGFVYLEMTTRFKREPMQKGKNSPSTSQSKKIYYSLFVYDLCIVFDNFQITYS
jgi:hypothetical protein